MALPHTIFAVSTAPGRAAIAVIRVSGPAASDVLHQLANRVPKPRKAELATLRDPGNRDILDQALILFFQSPASETGEDIAELQVHGGRAVVEAVLGAIARVPGCRPAEPGEFAHRAFINGKMDLTAAEGLADLIDAETEAQRKQAINLATGRNAELYTGWRSRLIECQALIESAIDFSDEGDVSEHAASMATERAQGLQAELAQHLAGAERGEIIRDGFRVVIAGPPNAGKSTLLNALAGRDAAIVSDEAGTTRDAIEVHLNLSGLAIIVTDTAGIRDTEAKVEAEGIRRALQRADAADLVIWLSEADQPAVVPADLQSADLLKVLNKVDLSVPATRSVNCLISAATGQGLDELTGIIVERAERRFGTEVDLVPTSARQAFHLNRALDFLQNYLSDEHKPIELRAEDLRLAADSLGRLTGKVDAEDVLDQIFSRFCIGK